MGVLKPELIFKSIVPVIMAGILGIYGLIISLLIFQKGKQSPLIPAAIVGVGHLGAFLRNREVLKYEVVPLFVGGIFSWGPDELLGVE